MKKFPFHQWIIGLTAALTVFVAAAAATGKTPPPRKDGKISYIVLMQQLPLVAYDGGTTGYAATKPGKGSKINPKSAHVKKYGKFLQSSQEKALASVSAPANSKLNQYTFAINGFSALLTPAQAENMKRAPGVQSVRVDEWRYPQTDASGAFLGLTGSDGAWLNGYTGEGVVVGVIDTGLWPEHPSFADNGAYGPLPAFAGLPCEFGNTAHNPNDAAFNCNNKLLGARQMLATYRSVIGAGPDEFDSARDDDGHGTHTASTAVGNAGVAASVLGVPRGIVSGIAPGARIIAYKGLGNLGGFSSDLAAAIDQAVADGVDVINYSIGSGSFAIGPDDIAFLFAADAGVFVATSNGNSGPNPATTGSPASVPWVTSVGASTQKRFFQGSARTGAGQTYFGASITGGTAELPLVDAASAGNEYCYSTYLTPAVVTGKIVLCRRGGNARADKSYAVYLAGGAGMIMYNTTDAQELATDTHWVPSVQINNTDGLAIKGYIASAGTAAVAKIGASSKVHVAAPWMAAFSSRGPNRLSGDIVKPDITAPGVQILAGASPFPGAGSVQGELFQAIAGTSMASPHIAGIFALIKQAHPDWSAAMAKSAIMTTAHQNVKKEDGIATADPFDMGAGHVSPGGPANKGSAFQPGLVYDAGLFEYAAFTCGAKLDIFSAAGCALLESIDVPSNASDLNLPSIGIQNLAGAQTVERTVTSVAKENGWRDYTVAVEAPPGYSVSVSPNKLRLKSGQSATYQVTVTNRSAVASEWSHGALTWNDNTGHYKVRSPISVKGALFGAPAAIAGSGFSGSASFNVGFGYSGSYTAAAHGLLPATVFSGTVTQDPDQIFNSGDGYSKSHAITVSDAAHLRIALPPGATEANADLDIYLRNPSGQIAVTSTNGGTDEVINVVAPANGTWTVFVHGWATPDGDSPYNLYSWTIPNATGGNMSITAAPTSATSGATASVIVEWTGATAGQWHLGAVSHTGPSGRLGVTMMEVDNH
jgi:subtilisin family serine protease